MNKLEKEIYRIYKKSGQWKALEYAEKMKVPFKYCEPCECMSGSIDSICVICDTPNLYIFELCNYIRTLIEEGRIIFKNDAPILEGLLESAEEHFKK